jgi:hypothetical protein
MQVAQSVEARVQEFDRLYKAAFGKDENNPVQYRSARLQAQKLTRGNSAGPETFSAGLHVSAA